MRWTNEKPTKPGYYWVKPEGSNRAMIELITEQPLGLYVWDAEMYVKSFSSGTLWSDAPIEEPE